jgi:hypothetical protein
LFCRNIIRGEMRAFLHPLLVTPLAINGCLDHRAMG